MTRLLAAAAAFLFLFPAQALAAPAPSALSELREDSVFVVPESRFLLSDAQEDQLELLATPQPRVFVVVLAPDLSRADAGTQLQGYARALDLKGVYVGYTSGHLVAGSVKGALTDGRAQAIADSVDRSFAGSDLTGEVTEFVKEARTAQDPPLTKGVLVVWLVIAVVLVGGIVVYVVLARRRRRQQALLAAEQLRMVLVPASEDVTRFGEDLAARNFDASRLPPPAQETFKAALDSYETATRQLDAANVPGDLRGVSSALDDGRYSLVCTDALLAGEPLPTRRAPCFFDPRHGPSVTDVEWSPSGGASRLVPACASDVTRLRSGELVDARRVDVNGRLVPYYEAPASYGPWAGGYYGPYAGGYGFDGLFTGMLVGSMLSSHGGDGAATDSSGNDFGGGSGDWGGSDFGGGDFGSGGDW